MDPSDRPDPFEEFAMVRRFLRGVAVVALLAGIGVVAGPAAAGAAPCMGTAPIQINSMAFIPTSVAPGQSSTVTAVVQNCTNQAFTTANVGSSYWYGIFTTPRATGIAPGCPAVDPLPQTLSVPAGGQVSVSSTWRVVSSCTATLFTASYHVTSSDGVSVTASATLTIGPAAPQCTVAYQRQSEWTGGFVAGVTVKNGTAAPLGSWTLQFAFPGDQQITNAWNATVTQAGNGVTAKSPSYGSIPAGASYTFGFQGTWHASDAPPSTFTLNGARCSSV
jgi:hypothetical protein